MTEKRKQLFQRIHTFLENPQTLAGYLFQGFIVILILISVTSVIIEFFYSHLFVRFESSFHALNLSILVIFTIEYLLRLITAPRKWQFVVKPFSLVDFFAIAPNYVEFILPFFIETTELRVFRLIRLLRFVRSIRLLMLLRYRSIFTKVIHYRGTILQAITPVVVFLGLVKVVIWVLEVHGWWIHDTNLDELFAIIGFALGIILSEKIQMTHDKFLQVENTVINLYGVLGVVQHILNRLIPGKGTARVKAWTTSFLSLLRDPKADNFKINEANEILYKEIATIEHKPADMHNYYLKICEAAAFCLNKKEHLTPKAYDTLLHQATLVYLVLIAIFIPGFTGLVSVLVATYVLYGMYHLTQDMDSIVGGEYNLINIRTAQLERLLEE